MRSISMKGLRMYFPPKKHRRIEIENKIKTGSQDCEKNMAWRFQRINQWSRRWRQAPISSWDIHDMGDPNLVYHQTMGGEPEFRMIFGLLGCFFFQNHSTWSFVRKKVEWLVPKHIFSWHFPDIFLTFSDVFHPFSWYFPFSRHIPTISPHFPYIFRTFSIHFPTPFPALGRHLHPGGALQGSALGDPKRGPGWAKVKLAKGINCDWGFVVVSWDLMGSNGGLMGF